MDFYKERYDVIIIGGSLAGLAAAVQLQSKGVSNVLVLERGNFPGGQAAGYVQNGFEFQIPLPGTMFVGTKKEPSKTGQFLHDMGMDGGWQPVSECYRVVLPDFDIDVTLHAGYERAAREINAVVPGTYDGVIGLMNLCRQVHDSMDVLSGNWPGRMQMMMKHAEFVRTAGYSAAEIISTFRLPQKAVDILNAQWVYMGYSLDTVPFTEYALWMAECFAENRLCQEPLAKLALKMQKKAEASGIQVEFCQEVDKILVKNGKVLGVRTAHGDEIHGDYVISTLYPDKVYPQMVEPSSEVPQNALRFVNSHKLSAAPVSVIMTIDGTPEENGIRNHFTFFSNTLDDEASDEPLSDAEVEHILTDAEPPLKDDVPAKGCPTNYDCITAVCPNYASRAAVPEGYTLLYLTALAPVTAFQNIGEDAYHDVKRRLADELIAAYINISGVDFRPWITEVEVTTAVTISHRLGTWKGAIYGHVPAMEHHVAARLRMKKQERFIEGLAFAGMDGNDAGIQVPGGLEAAQDVLNDMDEKRNADDSGQKTDKPVPQKGTDGSSQNTGKPIPEEGAVAPKQKKEAVENGKQN